MNWVHRRTWATNIGKWTIATPESGHRSWHLYWLMSVSAGQVTITLVCGSAGRTALCPAPLSELFSSSKSQKLTIQSIHISPPPLYLRMSNIRIKITQNIGNSSQTLAMSNIKTVRIPNNDDSWCQYNGYCSYQPYDCSLSTRLEELWEANADRPWPVVAIFESLSIN